MHGPTFLVNKDHVYIVLRESWTMKLISCWDGNFYSEGRDSLIRKIAEHSTVQVETVTHTELFIDIMTFKNKDTLIALAKFV